MAILMLGEIQGILNGLEYRFQYLLILYIVVPSLIIGGILEYIGFKKLMNRLSILMLFPFLIAMGLSIAMLYEGNSDSTTLSYFVISIELIAIFVFSYSLLKVIQQNEPIKNNKN
ncbi:MAG: hypothetical protein COA58_16865 [Bacteroidetes bacterium]|nr:MAG: hypothetical protein COA58_16865 [Bacteroidota bacterium]